MIDFFVDMTVNPFLLTGLLAGILAAVACGCVGPYVVTRRITFLSGAIAHIAVGGVGAALFLAHRFPQWFAWCDPLYGATVAALAAAVLIAWLRHRVHEGTDTLIGAMWAVGMACGILLSKFTPGYQGELIGYLFGSLSFVHWRQIIWIGCLDLIVLITVFSCHKRLMAVCLDPEQAELQGISVLGTNTLLLCLVALTVICLTQVVGLILVIALLTLPAATAGHYVQSMKRLMLFSTILSLGLTTLPRIAVYGTAVSPEAAIVLSAAGVYVAGVLWSRFRTR
ncbi:MAG: metal ABC transporter permease [Planctomycetota bacterium]|nr:MAG: metal ABC transporter permease [Planctomycetota bacterium]